MSDQEFFNDGPDAIDDDSPYCECGAVHGIEETDFNVCDCCGKAINP